VLQFVLARLKMVPLQPLLIVSNRTFYKMSVGNPWLRLSSHPQEKEGGPKKNVKKKKKKKKTPPYTPLPLRPPPPPLLVESNLGKLGERR
jgi:hypothetical protein